MGFLKYSRHGLLILVGYEYCLLIPITPTSIFYKVHDLLVHCLHVLLHAVPKTA